MHTSAYVSIRQHTSAYATINLCWRQATARCSLPQHAYVSIRQHTSAYVSIRQHTSAYVSIRQHTPACASIPRAPRSHKMRVRLTPEASLLTDAPTHAAASSSSCAASRRRSVACLRFASSSAYVSMRRHTSAYIGIRRHTSAYVSIRQKALTAIKSYVAPASA
jgi:hypothetical protein